MAKKNARKPSGAAGMKVIDDDLAATTDDVRHESNGIQSESEANASKPSRNLKPKVEQHTNGNLGVADIKKAAVFANSIGGLDKAIAVLQILKVAKEVQ